MLWTPLSSFSANFHSNFSCADQNHHNGSHDLVKQAVIAHILLIAHHLGTGRHTPGGAEATLKRRDAGGVCGASYRHQAGHERTTRRRLSQSPERQPHWRCLSSQTQMHRVIEHGNGSLIVLVLRPTDDIVPFPPNHISSRFKHPHSSRNLAEELT